MVDTLNREFPSYSAAYVSYADKARYVLVTTDDSDPWCLISSDPDEIRAALKGGAPSA
jgi:hypothetical protein